MTMHEKMSLRIFLERTKSDDFMTTEEIVQRLRAANYWDETSNEKAILNFQMAEVRKQIRKIKDNRGRPVFANIELPSENGDETVHGYMQQALFEPEHYEQVIAYHNQRAKHHIVEAHEYAKDLKQRYSVQLELPYPLLDTEMKKAA